MRLAFPLLSAALLASACSSSDSATSGNGDDSSVQDDVATPVDTSVDPDVKVNPPVDGGPCLGGDIAGLAGGKVLVGASMEQKTAKSAPFDAQYQYLSGGLFDSATVCSTCPGCTSSGTSCGHSSSSPGGCAWWGCWQDDASPPGGYLRGIISSATGLKQMGMISYYEMLQASKVAEGDPEVGAANDAAFMNRYLGDWAFVAKQVGASTAFLHIEPDFWGYAEQHALKAGSDAHKIPAAVSGFPDCSSIENSIAGLGKCMIAIAHKYAPNAKVGLHASAWGNDKDAISDPSVDLVAEAKAVGNFLAACGAGEGDVVFTDVSDRDAGSRGKAGSFTTGTGPGSYAQLYAWGKVVAETVGKPIVYWQIPVGNASGDDSPGHYKDNAVDTMFADVDKIAASHGVAMFFGAGAGDQTTPETDGGNLVAKVKAYKAAGGATYCK